MDKQTISSVMSEFGKRSWKIRKAKGDAKEAMRKAINTRWQKRAAEDEAKRKAEAKLRAKANFKKQK
jgi:cell division GTPase FtsZ